MIWTIVRREALEQIQQLRVLCVGILWAGAFGAAGVIYRSHATQHDAVSYHASVWVFGGRALRSLEELASAEVSIRREIGGAEFLAQRAAHGLAGLAAFTAHSEQVMLAPPESRSPFFQGAIPLDWAFIVGVLGPLLAALVAYDAVNSERRGGTLQLTLAGLASRRTVILGKLAGALVTVHLWYALGAVLFLLVTTAGGSVDLTGVLGLRVTLAWLSGSLALCFWCASALALSALVASPERTLVTLLLLWAAVAMGWPAVARAAGDAAFRAPSATPLAAALGQVEEPHSRFMLSGPAFHDPERCWASVEEVSRASRALRDDAERRRARRERAGHTLLLASPVGALELAFDALSGAGTGVATAFVAEAERSRRALRAFIETEWRRAGGTGPFRFRGSWDCPSPQVEGPWQTTVAPASVPLPAPVRVSIASSLVEFLPALGVLAAYALLATLAAVLIFERADVR